MIKNNVRISEVTKIQNHLLLPCEKIDEQQLFIDDAKTYKRPSRM